MSFRFEAGGDDGKEFMFLACIAQIIAMVSFSAGLAFFGFPLNFFICIIPAFLGLAVAAFGRSCGIIQILSLFSLDGFILFLFLVGGIFILSAWWFVAIVPTLGIVIGFIR